VEKKISVLWYKHQNKKEREVNSAPEGYKDERGLSANVEGNLGLRDNLFEARIINEGGREEGYCEEKRGPEECEKRFYSYILIWERRHGKKKRLPSWGGR